MQGSTPGVVQPEKEAAGGESLDTQVMTHVGENDDSKVKLTVLKTVVSFSYFIKHHTVNSVKYSPFFLEMNLVH